MGNEQKRNQILKDLEQRSLDEQNRKEIKITNSKRYVFLLGWRLECDRKDT